MLWSNLILTLHRHFHSLQRWLGDLLQCWRLPVQFYLSRGLSVLTCFHIILWAKIILSATCYSDPGYFHRLRSSLMSMLVGRVNISNCLLGTPFPTLLFPFTLPLQFLWFESCSPEQCRQVHTFLCIHIYTYTSVINNISRWSSVSAGITAHDLLFCSY